MIATAIPAAMRPYSMAVAPDSSFRKREVMLIDASMARLGPLLISRPRAGGTTTFRRRQKCCDLAQAGADLAHLGIQRGTDRLHGGDDRHGDASRDQTIFNGRRAGLVLQKTD